MEITSRILELRRLWATAFAGMPLYLQLGPPDASVPYAVLSILTVDQNGSTTNRPTWAANLRITAYVAKDADALSMIDTATQVFDRAKSNFWHFIRINSANVQAMHTERGTSWIVEISLNVAWSTERN